MVELVDESACFGRLVLGDFVDEGAVIETVDLLEFLFRFRPFKKVMTEAQHSWTTSDGAFGGQPTSEADALSHFPANGVRAPQSRGYKSPRPFARTCWRELGNSGGKSLNLGVFTSQTPIRQ